jgi:hypothetical protein
MTDRLKPGDVVVVTAADPRTRITGIVQFRKDDGEEAYVIDWKDGTRQVWAARRLEIKNDKP